MFEPARPIDEKQRLDSLRALDVLYAPAEERFDRITRLAAKLLDTPIALISLIDAECQWFKSAQGLDISETPRAVSFCAQAILDDETLVVPDASTDPRFSHNPLVTGEPFIRFYAGHPVTAPGGMRLGTLCVIDRKPRELSPAHLGTLRDLAAWVSNELRVTALSKSEKELLAERDTLLRKTLVDPLTQLWNRRAILDVLRRELYRASRQRVPTSVLLVDLDGLKHVNETHGHSAGDTALRNTAKVLRGSVRLYDAVGRHEGDDFLLVLVDCDSITAATIAERVRSRVEVEALETPAGLVYVTASVGSITWNGPEIEAGWLVATADRALRRAQSTGGNRIEIEEPEPASSTDPAF